MGQTKTHWLSNPNKNYLGHWDLPETGDLILTIASAKWEPVKNPVKNITVEKRVIRWKEKGIKPFICNETNARSIVLSTGARYMEDAVGKKIALYRGVHKDRITKMDIDCIRIRNTKVKDNKPELTPDSPKWELAKKSGLSLKEIRKHYNISDENYKLLIGES